MIGGRHGDRQPAALDDRPTPTCRRSRPSVRRRRPCWAAGPISPCSGRRSSAPRAWGQEHRPRPASPLARASTSGRCSRGSRPRPPSGSPRSTSGELPGTRRRRAWRPARGSSRDRRPASPRRPRRRAREVAVPCVPCAGAATRRRWAGLRARRGSAPTVRDLPARPVLGDDASPQRRLRRGRHRAPAAWHGRAPPGRPPWRGRRAGRGPGVPPRRSAAPDQLGGLVADRRAARHLDVVRPRHAGAAPARHRVRHRRQRGIDGAASSLDTAVRAAAAIAEHSLRAGDRVRSSTSGAGSGTCGRAAGCGISVM